MVAKKGGAFFGMPKNMRVKPQMTKRYPMLQKFSRKGRKIDDSDPTRWTGCTCPRIAGDDGEITCFLNNSIHAQRLRKYRGIWSRHVKSKRRFTEYER